MNRTCVALGLWISLLPSLSAQTILVEFSDGVGPVFSEEERAVIVEIARATDTEVREFLPQLPPEIRLTVTAGSGVIPETGETGLAPQPGHVSWTVDPSRPEGVVAVVRTHLRSTLFHELHHLARGYVVRGGEPRTSFMDAVVSEGMATAFERDFAGTTPPWGSYPDDVAAWVDELLALPPMSAYGSYQQWMFQHADGRRWIGYRVGTYIVDQAMLSSGLSSADLVLRPTDEILELAGVN
ncbi:MAG: DUF2268 domain-containing putative Zn-dependent protease [Acidobacteria bacterium]|nr:DUF2268 domain-containing putative Zn-dependent protease [Acidobacteriota bacterium]